MRLARAGACEGTAVWAARQTKGRGRRGRAWESERGNLALSVILRPDLPLALAGRLAVSSALAVVERLREITGADIRTKWPNDLYLNGAKVGGILIETQAHASGALGAAVAGLGLNVANHPVVEPPGTPATSLAAHGGALELEALAQALGEAIVAASAAAASRAWGEWVGPRWRTLDLACGPIRILEEGCVRDGEGLSILADGSLRARVGGAVVSLAAAEISVRPF